MPRVALPQLELHVEERGAGPPLLLAHGFPLDHSMWRGQLDALAATHHVIAPDLRGFGRSDVRPGVAGMAQLADDLADLLDALGVRQPAALCGLSMGGYVAWQFWKRHRRRLAGLILCDTRAAVDAPATRAHRHELAARVLAEGTGPLADTMPAKLFCEATRAERPEVVEAARQVMLRAPVEGVAAALRGMAEREDFAASLPAIDTPALVICGAEDIISPPAEARGIAAAMPRAAFVEIPRAGHMAPLEQPAAVNEAMQGFLARL